jgi:hypothetical protein
MNAYELLIYLQKVIDAGRGHEKIIIFPPEDGHELEIKDAIFFEHGIDTYESTSEHLDLITKYYY